MKHIADMKHLGGSSMDPSAEDLFGDFVARSIRNSQGLYQYLTGKYSEYQVMRDNESILSMRALYDVCTRFCTEDLSEMRISPTDTEKAQILALQEQINGEFPVLLSGIASIATRVTHKANKNIKK